MWEYSFCTRYIDDMDTFPFSVIVCITCAATDMMDKAYSVGGIIDKVSVTLDNCGFIRRIVKAFRENS